jgi:hypothetical protein
MKCPDYIEWIAQKVNGTLPFDHLEKLDAHLKVCELCRAELLLQKGIHESLKREMPSGLSADFTRRVSREALSLAGMEKKRWRLPDLVPVFSLATASVLLIVFRSEVGQFLSPAMQTLGGALTAGGAAVEESAAGVLAKVPAVPEGPLFYLERAFTPAVTTMTAGAFALGMVFWSLSRVRAYLRD